MSGLFEYDEATLSIVCPVCSAAVTAKCLYRKPTGGLGWLEQPHVERVLKAHPPDQPLRDYTVFGEVPQKKSGDIWGKGE